jgi:hypothetical protein
MGTPEELGLGGSCVLQLASTRTLQNSKRRGDVERRLGKGGILYSGWEPNVIVENMTNKSVQKK